METTHEEQENREKGLREEETMKEEKEPRKEMEEQEEEEQPASVSTEGDDYFADVGFMIDASLPVRLEHFHWETTDSRNITVALHVADDTPGAVQSGHYLWPAATMLAEYLVKTPISTTRTTSSIVELGAGCALASLTALQVFASNVQCIIVTDHDPGTLVRARDNLETTLQMIVDAAVSDGGDDDLNAAINELASVPVEFEPYEWGQPATKILKLVQEHIAAGVSAVDLVLGTDLIYCKDVVEPLLQTSAQLISKTGRFLLSQSFAYDKDTEGEIDRVCSELELKRTILQDDDTDDGVRRIQEFVAAEKEEG